MNNLLPLKKISSSFLLSLLFSFLFACAGEPNNRQTIEKQILLSQSTNCVGPSVADIQGIDANNNDELDPGEFEVTHETCLELGQKNSYLNDTGIIDGASLPTGNHSRCYGDKIATQDCAHGADVLAESDEDGFAGFAFRKIDFEGQALPNNSEQWACVLDTTSGLTWEIKSQGNGITGDNGLHDADDLFTWYNSLPDSNGGHAGALNEAIDQCFAYSTEMPLYLCNTQAYIARVNLERLCGYSDWRVPTLHELFNVSHLGVNKAGQEFQAVIDRQFFPNTQKWGYWSSNSMIEDNEFVDPRAWILNFQFGTTMAIAKSDARYLRLVRGPKSD